MRTETSPDRGIAAGGDALCSALRGGRPARRAPVASAAGWLAAGWLAAGWLAAGGSAAAQTPVASAPAGVDSDDAYALPAAREPAALLAFVRELVQQKPPAGDEQQQAAEMRKVARTVEQAARTALASAPAAEQETEATYFLLQGLDILRQLGDETAASRQRDAIDAARASGNREAAAVGLKFAIETSLAQWASFDDARKSQLIDELLAHLSGDQLEPNDAQTVMVVADFLGEAQDLQLARRLLDEALPKFRDHPAAEVQGMTPLLEGIARRLDLPGTQIALAGALLGGGQLDWEQYRGKVVLVDFWASWCGPCQAELPNVLQMYRAYHDKGFEVVGICLDDDPEQAAAFVKKQQLPWPTLFSDDAKRRGWEDPRAVEFGVTGIPLAILLDREGRVVSMNARGEQLPKQLQQVLGEPLVKNEPAAADEPEAGAIGQSAEER